MEFRVITRAMDLFPYQHLYFTTLEYDQLRPVFPEVGCAAMPSQLTEQNVLLLTGIASPRQMTEDITPMVKSITPLTFPDHHRFRRKDIRRLEETFAAMPSPKCIITTEKDATRLTALGELADEVKKNLYALPVRIRFMSEQDEESFNQNIIGYVRKNSRNSILAMKKDAPKPKPKDKPDGNKPRTITFR